MTQGRLRWLLPLLFVLLLLRWWSPGASPTTEVPETVQAIARDFDAPAQAASHSSSVSRSLDTTGRLEALDVAGNAFAVRLVIPPEPPPPPPLAPRPVKMVVVAAPEPMPMAPPPPPPPPALRIIGTWDDGAAPGVFVATDMGAVLARPGTMLLSEYMVTEVSPHQVSIIHAATKHVWQIPVPRAIAP